MPPARAVSASAAAGDGSGCAGADPAVPELIRPCAQVGVEQTQVAEAIGQAQKLVLSLELDSEAAQLILTGSLVSLSALADVNMGCETGRVRWEQSPRSLPPLL